MQIIHAVLASAAMGASLAGSENREFMDYLALFGKSYDTEAEFSYRKAIFNHKKAYVDTANQMATGATFGLN